MPCSLVHNGLRWQCRGLLALTSLSFEALISLIASARRPELRLSPSALLWIQPSLFPSAVKCCKCWNFSVCPRILQSSLSKVSSRSSVFTDARTARQQTHKHLLPVASSLLKFLQPAQKKKRLPTIIPCNYWHACSRNGLFSFTQLPCFP